jgi:plasmid rolling circle replication initiator protein Rep
MIHKYTENLIKQAPPPKLSETANVFLDTLAQLGKPTAKAPLILQTSNLVKRARSKFVSNHLALALVDTKSPLYQSYWNTWHCNEQLEQNGKSITGRYCNNRWCSTCNRIRTAKLIIGYTKPLSDLEDKQFVTLTIPNVKASALPTALEDMAFVFNQIREVFKKRKTKMIGIRKIECTYNAIEDTYHPHYHLVVAGLDVANEIVEQWVKRFPEANKAAQDVREANDNAVKELFKYFTKIATYSKIDKKRKIHVQALDIIFRAMRGKRVFQPMGIKKEVSEDIEEIQSQQYNIEDRNVVWKWVEEYHDWVDSDTGELLTGFVPGDGVLELLRNIEKSEKSIHYE